MKTDTITIKIDSAKAQALAFYLQKKNTTLDAEIADAVDKLYERIVPKDARDLIDWQAGQEEKPKRPTAPKKAGDGQ